MLQGLEMSIPSEDYFSQKLSQLRDMSMQWAETAKKVIIFPTLSFGLISYLVPNVHLFPFSLTIKFCPENSLLLPQAVDSVSQLMLGQMRE